MTQLKCVAIDDEPLSLALIREYISRSPSLRLLQTFEDAVSGAEFLRHNPVDLLFVDINMPDINGMDLVRSLEEKPTVIFITAYKKFAVEGFELEAMDYLLKPVDYDRFSKAVKRAVTYHEYKNGTHAGQEESLFVRSEYKMVKIDLRNIAYIEGLEDYIRIHLATGKPIMTLMTLKAVLDKLPGEQFRRIHRSYIVPLNRVVSVLNRKAMLDTGTELPISDSYASVIDDWKNR
ncbi:LytTR family DNA-binding domain-containing protein [uncultured Chitinophaga sp.]|uniref:LytR/AlgR family response regulator transcription factor n=1 Tax=uncultured Chitinophaga sp. TaxID=339340 RepID=UPI0025F14936|nr:LytTR family DNA-binding domain-containing protein [uncultured Chitinophaga sp.]